MKVRVGFVSNSSSSSFVIAVKYELNEYDVIELVKEYGDAIRINDSFDNNISEYTSKDVGEYIFDKLDYLGNDKETIIDRFGHGSDSREINNFFENARKNGRNVFYVVEFGNAGSCVENLNLEMFLEYSNLMDVFNPLVICNH